MRALIIVVEGQTEEEFVSNSLFHFLFIRDITDVRAIKIQTSPGYKGGLVNYDHYKRDITKFLKREKDVVVTSLIDFFRLPTGFPKYQEAKKIKPVTKRVEFLEKALSDDVKQRRFIPYIQLHEFEGLLFSDTKGFHALPDIPASSKAELKRILEAYPNPEMINDGPETAPSKRLLDLIPGYQKNLHGPFIALENGIEPILEKCPRFKAWVDSLIAAMKK